MTTGSDNHCDVRRYTGDFTHQLLFLITVGEIPKIKSKNKMYISCTGKYKMPLKRKIAPIFITPMFYSFF